MKNFTGYALAAFAISATSAFAADLPSRKAPPPVYAVPAPVFTWSGLYLGVNAGAFINQSRLTTAVASGKESGAGVLIGGTLGYNWQFANNLVIGLETDLDYRGKTSVSTPFTTSSSARDGYLGTFRGRLGYSWDRVLLYGTAGLAYGTTVAPNALTIPAVGYFGVRSGNNGGTMVGWTAGAGLEYAITDNWSIKAEYLYADLGRKTLAYVTPVGGLTSGLVPTATREHIVRAGINYRFNWGASAPVIAKY